MVNLDELENTLKIKFKDIDILRLALTHKSYSPVNNDRLEFLGDSILNFTATTYLFNKFGDATSGDMSRIRGFSVSGKYLAKIAEKLDIGKYIILGNGEKQSHGDCKPSILSSTLEAVIAAIYISNGLNEAKNFILNNFNFESIPFETDKNYKGKLQSYALKSFSVLPVYNTYLDVNEFVSQVILNNKTLAKGTGPNKKTAENNAAFEALKELEII